VLFYFFLFSRGGSEFLEHIVFPPPPLMGRRGWRAVFPGLADSLGANFLFFLFSLFLAKSRQSAPFFSLSRNFSSLFPIDCLFSSPIFQSPPCSSSSSLSIRPVTGYAVFEESPSPFLPPDTISSTSMAELFGAAAALFTSF